MDSGGAGGTTLAAGLHCFGWLYSTQVVPRLHNYCTHSSAGQVAGVVFSGREPYGPHRDESAGSRSSSTVVTLAT